MRGSDLIVALLTLAFVAVVATSAFWVALAVAPMPVDFHGFSAR